MRLRRLLVLLLTLSTLVSIIPAAVFAAETDEGAGNEAGDTVEETVINAPDNLFMDKTVVLNRDGTYSINLEAYATGSTITKTITEGVPLDVVLVMDQSGSLVSKSDLLTGLKSSVTTFLEALRADGDKYGVNHRVAICGFASYGKQNSSGLAQDKFTFANDTQDNAWINTGIFVNGEFRDYGTVEYIPVDDETSISTGNYYVIDYDSNDDEILEKVTVFYYKYNGMWVTSADNEDGYIVVAETTQELREKYNVYQVGNSRNLLSDTDYANAWENISDGQGGMNKDVSTAVDNLASNGATAIFMGMKMARKMLDNLPAEAAGVQRKKVVIVFTDGEPGFAGYTRGDGDAALAEAAKIKEGGTEIYAVGLYANAPSANAETFMNRLSSNYKSHNFGTTTYSLDPGIGSSSANDVLLYSRNIDGTQGGVSPYFCIDENGNYWPVYIFYDPSVGKYYGYTITDSGEGSLGEVAYALENHVPNSDPDANYYKHASDIGELSSIFQTISSEVTDYTAQLTLDATAILMDVLGEGFTFTDNTKITVSVVPGSVSEENSGLTAEELTADKITWDEEAQEVLSFTCREASEGTGEVTVNGAVDQTKMTITAKVADGAITVTGFNYSAPTDEHKVNAQYINVDHPGSKLVVNVTGVEAEKDVATNAAVATNQDTSGIYEGMEYDADGDGDKGELQVPFAVPDTYLTSEYYYLNEENIVTIDPKDFLMGSCLHVDADGYHYFTEAGFDTKYGTVTVNEDGTITYQLTDSAWKNEDVFYLFGKTEDATVTGTDANKDGYMWSKITILPPKDASGKLHLDKEATLTDNGTYTINLEAFATGAPVSTTIIEGVPLNASAILKDVMADGFKLTGNTTITVSVLPGSVKEEYANLDPDELTADHIAWGAPQQVLSFQYSTAEGAENTGSGDVIVNGAADQTQMTLKAEVKDGVITVTGFNYASPADNHKENAQYICAGHPGSKLVVTITGVEAQSNVVTDSVTVTNKGASGIYEAPGADADNDGVTDELLASFPIPTTYMASKAYVVDYAKTMTIDPTDFQMTVSAVSVDVDGYNHFDPAVTAVTGTYGKVTVEDGKITYTPTRTNWNGYDTFYVFGTTNNATIKAATANENGNMWAKVSVVPANNVYYEDTFVTNENTGVVGIVYKGAWEVVQDDKTTNADGNVENAESSESTTKDDQGNDHQGGVHGWEDNLADDTGFSDGSAHVAGTNNTVGATATFTFTFTGTGVDIYSRTNDKTGMVIAMLYEGTSTTGEDGKNLVAKYSLVVDNLAASGDYYQIPTLSFCQIPAKDENGKIIKDENGNTQMVPLPHGTYTVKITVSKANASQTGEVRTLYYLDGIRVYNPIQDQEGDSTVSGAYGEKELNANFVEIRDKLLDANSFSAEDAESDGPVFIDRITSADGSHTDNTKTVEIGTYKVFGPENEVYLSANQIVAFAVPYTEDAHYYIGMKSLTGKTVKVIPNSTDDYVNLIVVGHTTDQYYEVIPEWEYDEYGNPTTGVIYVHADITNGDYKKDEDGNYITDENGNYITEVDGAGAILALTKLKVTGPKAKNFKFARVSNDKLLEMIAEDLAPSLDMDDTNSSPDVGGNTPNKPNVDINKPDTDEIVDDQTAFKNLMIDLLTRIFSDLRGWFKS